MEHLGDLSKSANQFIKDENEGEFMQNIKNMIKDKEIQIFNPTSSDYSDEMSKMVDRIVGSEVP